MKRLPTAYRLIVAALLLTFAGAAQAQAIFLARKAIGRIEQMTQSSPPAGNGGSAYDVATVIVDVAADTVFAAVKRQIADSGKVSITRVDDARRSVEFGDGTQNGVIQVSELGDQLAQLLVSTARSGATTSAPTIAAHILDVCRQVGVSCELPQPR